HTRFDCDWSSDVCSSDLWGGRVAIGHATKLSTMDVPKQKEWAKRLADAGVAVTVLPATDLFLMGRERDFNVRRGLVDANLFVERSEERRVGKAGRARW